MALQPDLDYSIHYIDELNISAVYAKALPDLFQGELNIIFEVFPESFILLLPLSM